ncbi:MAG: hypothetical protein Q4F41_02005 [Eubacteriales bacterium]|nr:hypothetical protein [Eubacteriales bacterium]
MQIHVPVNQAFVRDEDWQAQGEVCIQPQIQDKAMGVDGDLSVILPEVLKSMAQIK